MSEHPQNIDQSSENNDNLFPKLSSENTINSEPIAPELLAPILPENTVVNNENISEIIPIDFPVAKSITENSTVEIINFVNSSEQLLISNSSEQIVPELFENYVNQDIVINDLVQNNPLEDWELAILNLPNLDTKPHDEDYLDNSSDQLNTGFYVEQNTVTMEMIYTKLLDLESEIFDLKKEITSLKHSAKSPETKTESKKTKKPDFTEVFNPLKSLRENGRDNLKGQLDKMTNDELKEIIRSYNIKKAKEMKGIDRPQMVSDIIQYAERELNRGGVFLQDR